MARPQKKGLDYFPLDVTMDVIDDNVVMLESKYGVDGFATLIKLYMKIYQDEGYFIKWDEKSSLLLSKRVNTDNNLVNDIINDLVNWGVFDKELYENANILTSRRIQKTYISAIYKRKDIEIEENILLLDEVNDNINLINSGIYPQRKEKKSKVDKSKENKKRKATDVIPIGELKSMKHFEDEQINKLFIMYLETRTTIKKVKNSQNAITMLINKLEKETIEDQKEMLENAIAGNYQTVFPIKKNGFNNKQDKPKTQFELEQEQIVKDRYSKYKV